MTSGFYPMNTALLSGKAAQSEADDEMGVALWPFKQSLTAAEAVAADTDYYFASAAMKVGAYTLLKTAIAGHVARNITVAVTQVGGVNDTMGTLDVVGTNVAGKVITETITPVAAGSAAGVKAFRTVTSITGVGWVRNAGAGSEDTIIIGFGDVVGFLHKLKLNSVVAAYENGAREATMPTVVTDDDELEKNTFDLNTALQGRAVDIIYLA